MNTRTMLVLPVVNLFLIVCLLVGAVVLKGRRANAQQVTNLAQVTSTLGSSSTTTGPAAPGTHRDTVAAFKALEKTVDHLTVTMQTAVDGDPVVLEDVRMSRKTGFVLLLFSCPKEKVRMAFVVVYQGGDEWVPADFFVPFNYEKAKRELTQVQPPPPQHPSGCQTGSGICP